MIKNLVPGLILAPMAQKWTPKFNFVGFSSNSCQALFKLSLYAISRKTNLPNLGKWQKTQFRSQLCPIWSKSGHQFFFKNIRQSLDGRLLSCTISEKTNDPILRKLQWRTDGQTDESDFIGRCPIFQGVQKCTSRMKWVDRGKLRLVLQRAPIKLPIFPMKVSHWRKMF